MSFEGKTVSTEVEFDARLRQHPRNVWTKFRVALQMIERRDFYRARRLLEGLRHHPDATADVFSIYWNRLCMAEAQHRVVQKINIPVDYLGSNNLGLLLPFRKLQIDKAVPKPYPWAMALPDFAGAGNAYQFLQESAAGLAGSFTPAIQRVHVIWSPLAGDDSAVAALFTSLCEMKFAGRLDVTIFGREQISRNGENLPGGGVLNLRSHGMQTPLASAECQQIARESDLIVFLSGAPEVDPMLLQRALHIAEISDAAVQPLVALPDSTTAAQNFTTLYSESSVRSKFSVRFPFREVAGLNMVMSARMLLDIGMPDTRFSGTFFAARELAYRAYVRGAWFMPLVVSKLDTFPDQDRTPADTELYKGLCPNHWDRKRDVLHEVPKVSIYIPAYNASKYIERSIESVLSQDVADVDICIANDGSRDGTLALLERLYASEKRVRWIDNPNGGIGFASNSAIRMSNSLYIGQLDSDDCLKPGAVRRLMSFLDDNPNVVCAYGSCERIDATGAYTQNEYAWPVFSREKMMITSIAHHFRMFRRQAWERTSRFREDIVNGVDYDIFLKLSEVGEFRHIEETLYQRRWHGENTSHVNEHHQTTNTHRVQREALARQGLARFWDVDVPDPEKPRNVSYKLKPDTKMVVFWPDYSRSNPYQKLLYGKMRQHTEVVAGEIDAAMKVIDSQAALPAEVTFHLHWLNFLFKPDADEATTRATVDAFLSKIEKFVWKGGRLVWTIHNTLSHDTAFPEIERDLSVRLAAVAHDLHFHSAASVAEVAETFDLPRDKVRISRHGNYIGAYPDYVSRAEARAALGIGADDDVILFTGQIRPYKGVEDLVLAFRRILADRPQARLLLAGRPSFDPLESISPGLTEAERSRILSAGRFVESGEWQLFLRAADIAAYPYQKILTSGSLLLALSFGVPAIIPQVGMTKEVLDGREAGRLYDGSGGAEALEAALRDLLSAKDEGRLDQMSRNARSLAEELDWPDFSAPISS